MLKIGMPAPDFIGESNQGKILLKDYIGKKNIILFFYPKDGTTICTQQLLDAEVAYEEYKRLDTEILGCNQDSLESHQQFAQKNGFTFSLISDPNMKIANAYEVGTLAEYPDFVDRTVYIIDFDGVISYAVKGNPSTEELIHAIESTRA